MEQSELNALIDQALLEMHNTAAPSKEEAAASEYSDADYAKLLADLQAEDEDLAGFEVDEAANPEEGEAPDLSISKMDGDKFYDKKKFTCKNGKIKEEKTDESIISIGGENLVEKTDSQKHDAELIDGMNEVERRLVMSRRIKDGMVKRVAKKNQEKIEITRMAFDQKKVNLSDSLTRWDKMALVEELTKKLRNLIRKYDEYINSRITRLLAPLIPAPIKVAKLKWPWTFVANPGFLYKTHKEVTGEIYTYWVTPNVPYYFKQGTEQQILEERDTELSKYFLESVDRAIMRRYEACNKLSAREVMYASRFASNTIKLITYGDLLNYNPFWFKLLYDRILKDNPYGDAAYSKD